MDLIPRLLPLVLLFIAPWAQAAETALKPIPVEDFFAEADYRGVQISPDGKYITFLTTLGTGHVGIALMDLATGKTEPLVAAHDENISLYFWKGPDLIVFGGDLGGNESLALRSIRLKDRGVLDLAESYEESQDDMANPASILDTLKLDPEHIVVLGNKSAGSINVGVFLLDVRNGDRTKTTGADEPGVDNLTVDNAGAVRTRDRRVGNAVVQEVRPNAKSLFYHVAETPADIAIEVPAMLPLRFAADNDTLYVVTSDPGQPARLRAYVTSKHAFAREPDFELPGSLDSLTANTADALVMSPDRTRLLGVYYLTDRTHVHWFDDARAALQAKIDAALPGTINRIATSTDDGLMHTVVALSDRQAPVYFLLNLRTDGARKPGLSLIGRANSKLDPRRLASMEPISYPSRDGLTIHGYLTLPLGRQPGQKLPFIINPHGGPFGIRDEWGFNPEVQFLVSRGYAVLQPNYRGSGGYGTDFLLAGRREWGGKMQNDLTDGVKWAIDQGIADPARVAIVGASYGGYAALAGVTFTPELYRCAVNYVGVSDLSIITSWARGQDPDHLFEKNWIGDDKDYLYQRSPVNFVQNIRVPTLHAYGENDPRVDLDHWKRLKAQLDHYGKPYEFVQEGNEGHGFHHESARIGFYRRVEEFLAQNLMGGEGRVDIKPVEVIEMPAKKSG
jgi:dipeptidyl aminopeptidase/acylaminoacyl peptidase